MNVAQLQRRIEKIRAWLEIANLAYEELVSRPAETNSIPGFDPEPKTKPCECRREWRRGRLCLACDNTGWRPLAAGEEGVDPYAADITVETVVVRDETTSSKRARELRRLESSIATLERNAKIRAGIDVAEDREIRNLRLVLSRPRALRKIAWAMDLLRTTHPSLYEELPRERALAALAMIVPGRIDAPPVS